jgi:hypothetical protein
MCLIALGISGPSEVRFDAQHQTYYLTKGIPLLAKTVHGPFDDVKAVVCKIVTSNRGITTYGIYIDWNNANHNPTLITGTRLAEAYPILDEVKTKLNIPTRWDE